MCSNLIADWQSNVLYCFYGHMHFLPNEKCPNILDCEQMNEQRLKIRGKTTFLLRLLCIYPKLVLHSIPKELVGCVGNLTTYNILRLEDFRVNLYSKYSSRRALRDKLLIMV